MKELSIFVDESGDFGEFEKHAPYYIVTMVFHDQDFSIQEPMDYLEKELSLLGLKNHCIHTGPIIRKEEEYSEMDYLERRKIFNKMVTFMRQSGVKYKAFYIEKKHIEDIVEATGKLSKQISVFIREHYDFISFEGRIQEGKAIRLQIFFGTVSDLKRNYLKIVNRQDIDY